MYSFSNTQEMHICWLNTSTNLKYVISLIYIFFHIVVPKKGEMTECYWETTDFILQAEHKCRHLCMNLKKHKFLRQKHVTGFYQSRNLLHEIISVK